MTTPLSLLPLLAVLEHAPMAMALVTDGRFHLVSREFERLMGCANGGLQGQSWEVLAPTQSAMLCDGLDEASREGRGFETELRLRRFDGAWLWARVHGAAATGPGGARQSIWTIVDVTERRRHRELLQWRATHDALTALVNRCEFEREVEVLVTDRRSRAPACALFIDLDHFKQVNDTAGHGAGDALLKRVAQALQAGVRAEDTVARLGGDEFAVLLHGCRLPQGMQVAEQLRAAVQAVGEAASIGPAVTASIGIVEIDAALDSLADVLEAADGACYAAKRAGRNRVDAAAGPHPFTSGLEVVPCRVAPIPQRNARNRSTVPV